MVGEIRSDLVINGRNDDSRFKLRADPGPAMVSAETLTGDDVFNNRGEHIGKIKDIILDTRNGKIGYAVLSYSALLNMGSNFFAVPWNAMRLDSKKKRFILDVEIGELKDAPNFDRNHWPDMADAKWASSVHSYYRAPPYYDFRSEYACINNFHNRRFG